jgi:hypothetical protein
VERKKVYSHGFWNTYCLEVKEVALYTSSFQHLPSFFGVFLGDAVPVHGTVVLTVGPGVAFLLAVIAGHRRLGRTVFGNMPLFLAMLASSCFDMRVGAVSLGMANLLSVKTYSFVKGTLIGNYPSSPQLKHLEPKPEPCPPCPPCFSSGQSLEKWPAMLQLNTQPVKRNLAGWGAYKYLLAANNVRPIADNTGGATISSINSSCRLGSGFVAIYSNDHIRK